MKTIQNDLSGSGQTMKLTRVVETTKGTRVRIIVKSDSVSFQSYAKAEVWSPAMMQWNNVADIHHAKMQTAHGVGYKPDRGEKYFKADADRLLNMAMQVIGEA